MEAGRELDALVAEKVMGWKFRGYGNGGGEWTLDGKQMAFGGHNGGSLPNYSTSIAAAWEIVEKLRQKYCCIKVYSDHAYIYECTIVKDPDDDHDAPIILEQAETGPLAICLAALKAKGVTHE